MYICVYLMTSQLVLLVLFCATLKMLICISPCLGIHFFLFGTGGITAENFSLIGRLWLVECGTTFIMIRQYTLFL